MTSASEFIKFMAIFNVLTGHGSGGAGVQSVNDIPPDGSGNVSLDSDTIPQGSLNIYASNDGGTTDNLSNLPTIVDITDELDTVKNDLLAHVDDFNNPHQTTLQQGYDALTNPQHINFAPASGLYFADSDDNIIFIFHEDFASFFRPFTVSQDGTNGLAVIDTTDPLSTFFEITSTDFGSIPFPVMTQTERNALNVTSSPQGLGVFNSSIKTIDVFNSLEWQNVLTIQNVQGSGTVTVTDNGDGTVTIDGSGGGTSVDGAFGSFSTQDNTSATTFTAINTFKPANLGTVFNATDLRNFTVQFEVIDGVSTPTIKSTLAVSQYYNVICTLSCRGAVATSATFRFSIYIKLANGTTVPTQYRKVLTLSDLTTFLDVTLAGPVELGTGDAAFLQIENVTNTNGVYVAYSNFEVASISGSAEVSLPNAYNGGNTIELINNRPVIIANQGTPYNFTTYSDSTTTAASDLLVGVRFKPHATGFVTALEYVDAHFTAGTRQVGIYRVSDQSLIVSALVSKSDPLDGTGDFRVHVITPVQLIGSEEYFVLSIIPNTNLWAFYALVGTNFDYTGITYTQTSATLVYPDAGNIANSPNAIYGNASFQYSTTTSDVRMNDSSQPDVFRVTGTDKASTPAPLMTTSQFAAISGLAEGMCGWDTVLHKPTVFDGTQVQTLSYDSGNTAGNWVPTFSDLVGISGSITVNSSRFIKQNNIVIFTQSISFTASDSTISFKTDLPTLIANNFTNLNQSDLAGQLLTTSSPTAMDGGVLSANAVVGDIKVAVSINSTVGSGVKSAKYSVMLEAQ